MNTMNASPETPSPADDAGWAMALFFTLIFLLLGLLTFWPWTKEFIPGLSTPTQVQRLGAAQRVSFVGGFATRTQVEAGGRTLLLYGAVEIEPGVALERRISPVSDRLCVVGTTRCHDIASR